MYEVERNIERFLERELGAVETGSGLKVIGIPYVSKIMADIFEMEFFRRLSPPDPLCNPR